MKKKILITIIIALFAFIAYQTYVFILADEDNINPIYLVPKNAVFIAETERPIDTWDEISASPIWQHLQTNSYFKELTSSITNFDATFQDKKDIIDFIGERDILISAHVYKPKKYGLLYIANLKKLSKLRFLKSAIQKLVGSTYKITKRKHKEQEILELYNSKTRETLYITFIKNQVIASYTHLLVEQSIEQYQTPVIGRDINFTEIKTATNNDGFFNIYLQHQYLKEYLACFTSKNNIKNLESTINSLFYTGLDVSIIEGSIVQAIGYTNVNQTSETFLTALQKSGKGRRSIAKIAPRNTSLYLSFAFEDFTDFHTNFEELQKENPKTFESYTKQVAEIEQQLNINLKENIYSWIGEEIGLVHFNSNLSKNKKDIAAIIKADNIENAKDNLHFILSKIKENTPLKYKQIQYQEFPIYYFDLKGFFKILAGNTFAKMEKPYFTIIDDFVIFSTNPNTLKEIINSHISNYTLETSEQFEEFNYQFDNKSSVFTYLKTPNSFNDFLSLVDRKTKQQLVKNKKYITSFSQIGIQFTPANNQFESNITLSYQSQKSLAKQEQKEKELKTELYQKITPQKDSVITETAESIFTVPAIHPSDLSAKNYTEYYNTKQLKLEVALENGMANGTYKYYYLNGNLKLKGQFKNGKKWGTWKAYEKESGKQIFKKQF